MRRAWLVTVMCLVAGAALGQGTAGTVELTPTVGFWFGDTLTRGATSSFSFDVDVDDAPQYGFRLAYRFTDSWALEGFLSRGRADLVTGEEGLLGDRDKLGNIDLTTAELGFEASFGHRRLVPFLAGGIGVVNLDPDVAGMSSDTRFAANFGGGFKLFFTPQLALRFDWRGHAVNIGDRQHDCDWWDDHCGRNDDWMYLKEVALGLAFVF